MDTAAQARITGGIACKYLSVLLMNQMLFPLFDEVFTYTRDISITASSAVLIAVAVLAMWRPSYINGRRATPVLVLGSLIGSALMGGGLLLHQIWMLVLGACVAMACRSLLTLSADLAAVSLPAGRMVICATAGILGAHIVDMALTGLSPWGGGLLATVLLPLATLALCYPYALKLLGITATSEPAAELSVVRPATSLPLLSTLYVFQFIVYMAFGVALRFGEVQGSPSFSAALSVVALVILLIIAMLRHKNARALDTLCNVVVLTLLAGLMLAAVHTTTGVFLANTVLMVGNSLYSVCILCMLVTLSQRNPLNALSVFGWANGIGGLGTTLGALMGTTGNALLAANNGEAVPYLIIGFAILLAGYVLFGLRNYSVSAQIFTVEPAPEAAGATRDEETFDAHCHRIAHLYDLTPREEETFVMLARGRNREYIENALQVSRNTVKAHVKHVYAKLGIHSHQELLDLVEQDEKPPSP